MCERLSSCANDYLHKRNGIRTLPTHFPMAFFRQRTQRTQRTKNPNKSEKWEPPQKKPVKFEPPASNNKFRHSHTRRSLAWKWMTTVSIPVGVPNHRCKCIRDAWMTTVSISVHAAAKGKWVRVPSPAEPGTCSRLSRIN